MDEKLLDEPSRKLRVTRKRKDQAMWRCGGLMYGCRRVFSSIDDLKRHLTCSKCGSEFPTGYLFHKHSKEQTCKDDQDGNAAEPIPNAPIGNSDRLKCTGCFRIFHSKAARANHMICSVCDRQFEVGVYFHKHMKSCKVVTCNGCKETFKSKELLMRHMKCAVCGNQFENGILSHNCDHTKSSITLPTTALTARPLNAPNEKTAKTESESNRVVVVSDGHGHQSPDCGPSTHTCGGCQKSFRSQETLLAHFECHCNLQFKNEQLYHDHENICDIYRCSGCKEVFRSLEVLEKHMTCRCNLQFADGQQYHAHESICELYRCSEREKGFQSIEEHFNCHCCLKFSDPVQYYCHERVCEIYRCQGCEEGFSFEDWKKHLTCHCTSQFFDGILYHTHVSQCRAYKCDGCLKTFDSLVQIEEHLTCDCGSKFNEGLRYHMHEPQCVRSRTCDGDGCGVKFDTVSALKKHATCFNCACEFPRGRLFHEHECITLECHICHATYRSPSALLLHMEFFHHFRCSGCHKGFYSMTEFRGHMLCSVCDRQFERGNAFHKHLETCRSSIIRCTVCEAQFTTYELLMRHIKCSLCNRQFSKCTYFHDHATTCTLMCASCEETFPSRELLLLHMTCSVCGRKFTKGSLFHKHVKACVKTCTVCREAFPSNELLMLHMKCSVCDRQFRNCSSFHHHVGTCKFVACTGCEETFSSKDLLILHMKCSVCERQFITGPRFHNHVRSCVLSTSEDLTELPLNRVVHATTSHSVYVKNDILDSTGSDNSADVSSSIDDDKFFVQVKLEPVDMDVDTNDDIDIAKDAKVGERDSLVKKDEEANIDPVTAAADVVMKVESVYCKAIN